MAGLTPATLPWDLNPTREGRRDAEGFEAERQKSDGSGDRSGLKESLDWVNKHHAGTLKKLAK
jgi:hypothetical protein